MELRNHPKLQDEWPPDWSGFYGRGNRDPRAEAPSKLLSIEKSDKRETIQG
jgi:hypothetical protein